MIGTVWYSLHVFYLFLRYRYTGPLSPVSCKSPDVRPFALLLLLSTWTLLKRWPFSISQALLKLPATPKHILKLFFRLPYFCLLLPNCFNSLFPETYNGPIGLLLLFLLCVHFIPPIKPQPSEDGGLLFKMSPSMCFPNFFGFICYL